MVSGLWLTVICSGAALTTLTLVSLWYHFRVRRPLRQLLTQVRRFGEDDFTSRAKIDMRDPWLVQQLAQALNDTANRLDHRFRKISESRDKHATVFSSMTEGVIAVDADEKIILCNKAASDLFQIRKVEAVGRSIQEMVRVPEIQDFIQASLNRDEPAEKDIELHLKKATTTLQLRSAPLRNSRGQRIGTVLGYNDITQLRKLESHRREFVANVSHELRTPLTSIQGFAETLMNPAVKDPEEFRRFLEIIHRHAARLGAIIDDLLALSRIEREVDENVIELKQGPLRPSIVAAVELCEVKAKRRHVEVDFDCEPELKARINPPLLEQALVNLIDNALKYSEDGQNVRVKGRREGKEVVLSVLDQGPGIPKHHLPRLFERFYRVDKARSRKQGGTGLGLSIVKHVSLAHRGRLEVESTLGQGSCFSIHLPV